MESRTEATDSDSSFGEAPASRFLTFKPRNAFAVPAARNGESSNRALIEAMVNSGIFRDYEKAFNETTGMPVALRPVESWQLPLHGKRNETAVPVRLSGQLIGFLQTGEASDDLNERDETFFEAKNASNKQHESVVKLLTIFAEHLSLLSNQVVVQQKNSEPPMITRAKEYIREHHAEDLPLGRVAKAVNTSMFYFCKMFKKATGINFTDYLSRVRIEKSKNLLLNPNLRVSEIAFEVGFQSLTHFNRVFKKILGQSPTEYRAQRLGH